jgi:hypothetical protein
MTNQGDKRLMTLPDEARRAHLDCTQHFAKAASRAPAATALLSEAKTLLRFGRRDATGAGRIELPLRFRGYRSRAKSATALSLALAECHSDGAA